jgi:hypothetical protein
MRGAGQGARVELVSSLPDELDNGNRSGIVIFFLGSLHLRSAHLMQVLIFIPPPP